MKINFKIELLLNSFNQFSKQHYMLQKINAQFWNNISIFLDGNVAVLN